MLRPSPAHLSTDESRTLSLLAAGLSNAEICEETGLPIRAVKGHVRTAQAVSGLSRRPDLARWATDQASEQAAQG
ncbi:MAG: Bacterial regulatory protein luxR family [Nocardioides sp.]|nr:Bacterial regulatory protein luxR family [Nocardioides sp.]